MSFQYRRGIIRILFSAATVFSAATHCAQAEEAQKPGIKTAVIFNTLCAKCHEGECSGRLSFDTGSEKAHTHIKRYAKDPNITEQDIKEFFTLLNHMKKECEILMPGKGTKGTIKPEKISLFAIPSQKAYFIPLGLLQKGSYRLNISTKEQQHYRIELLSDHFDPFLDLSICPDRKEKIELTIEEPVKAFLRIRSTKPLHILSLELSPQ